MSNMFIHGMETTIIKSDVVIYAIVLLGIIIYLVT